MQRALPLFMLIPSPEHLKQAAKTETPFSD
jgi:hypothetical protein